MHYNNGHRAGVATAWLLILSTTLLILGCASAPPVLTDDERSERRALYTDGQQVENFALLDAEGGFHELHRQGNAKAIVIYVQGNGCPIVRHGASDLRKVADEFGPQGVRFFMINATGRDKREAVRREAEDFNFPAPVLIDEQRIVADALALNRTGEALVIDPASWRIVYRGRINDRVTYEAQKPQATQHDLANALNDVLATRPVARPDVPSPGCALASTPAPVPTYTANVAPVLERNCVGCHREGGIGPWSMTDYDTVRGWAPMIRQVVRTKRMPPWHADPHIGELRQDMSLSPEDARTLVRWAEAGAPRGEGEDPLAALQLAALDEWRLGQPDRVLALSEHEIPATGLLPYEYDYLELDVEEDLWIKGVEFQPGNAAVLHHALGYVVPPGADGLYNWVDGVMITYAPGNGAEFTPPEVARFVPKGSKVFVELHYVTTGREEIDRSRVGFHFAEKRPERVLRTTGAVDLLFELAPGARNVQVTSEVAFDQPVVIHSLTPHMHYRGTSMKYTAVYPDGHRELLLSVPNYDFNWQRPYLLAEPRELPAGSRVEVTGTYDNSDQNRYNPHPDRWVRFGPQTTDEMFIGYITFTYADAADDLAHQDRNNPLLWFPVPDGKGNGGAAAALR